MAESLDAIRQHLKDRLKKLGRGAQTKLAQQTGLSQPHLSGFLKGTHGMSNAHLDLIAKYFGVPTPDLYLPFKTLSTDPTASSPVTPDQSIVASPITPKAGGHGISLSAERRRIQELEGFISGLLSLAETKAVEMRGVLHVGQPRRAARKKA